MIMINGNWEQVKDLSDVSRIVSENIGSEFAQKVEEQNLMLTNKIDNLNDRHKNIRKLFIQVLNFAEENLQNDEYENYIEEFDLIWNGDE